MLIDDQQCARAAGGFAAALETCGLGAGTRVAVIGPNTLGAVAARDAIAHAGATLVPIHPSLSEAERRVILEDADVAYIWDEDSLAHPPSGAPVRPAIGDTLIYTSGTTGKPKGCFRSKAREEARANGLIRTFRLTADDVHLVACPLAHSAPNIFLRAARLVNARTYLLPRFSVEGFAAAARSATICFLVPTQVRRLLGTDPGALRAVVVAGAPFPPKLKAEALEWLGEGRLWEFFGATELGTISVLPPDAQRSHGRSVGKPADGVDIELRDRDGQPVPVGETGEVFVRSDAVMDRYWHDVDAERGFRSVGDLARFDEDGYLYLVDRISDIIITGGANVAPSDVEAALLSLEVVDGAVVFSLPDDEWGETVCAVVATSKPTQWSDIDRALRRTLAGFKLPKRYAFVTRDELPVGSSGKPLRRAARKLFGERLKPAK